MNHVRMAMYRLERGTTSEVVEMARRDLVPQLRAMRGFVAYELVATAHDGLISYSAWHCRRDAQDAAGHIKKWVDANIADHILDSELHIGDVQLTERAAEPV